MARVLTPEQASVLTEANFFIQTRMVFNETGESLTDILGFNPIVSFTISSDREQMAQTLNLTLRLGLGATSLSPFLSTGAKVAGLPVLAEGRRFHLDIQCLPPLANPPATGWRRIFEGLIDTVTVQPQELTVTVVARDIVAQILSLEIENITPLPENPYAWGFPVDAGLVEAQMLQILNTAWNYSYGSDYNNNFNVVGGPSGTSASAFRQHRTTLAEALLSIGIGKNGWDLRGKWDITGLDTFAITYYLPDRAGVSPVTGLFTRHQSGSSIRYKAITELVRSIIGVKTVIEITPADEFRVPVITVNAAGVARYGRGFLAVNEDATSHIDTPQEAADLGSIIADTLGKPPVAITLDVPFVWFLEVNDLFLVEDDGVAYDGYSTGGTTFYVTSMQLKYDNGQGSAILSGRETNAATAARMWAQNNANAKPKLSYQRTGVPVGGAAQGAEWVEYE